MVHGAWSSKSGIKVLRKSKRFRHSQTICTDDGVTVTETLARHLGSTFIRFSKMPQKYTIASA